MASLVDFSPLENDDDQKGDTDAKTDNAQIGMARANQPRNSRCTESRLEWIVLGLGLLALFLLAISWRDLDSAIPRPPDNHEWYEKTFNDTLENAIFYREQIKAKKALDISFQTNCQGQGYTLATRDDGQPICYFYMDEDYIRRNKPDDDDDLDYEQSKKMCADKGEGWTLTDVKGPDDAQNIFNIFRSDSTNIFLGGTKASSSSSWKWEDGSPIDQYDGWTSGQPDSPSRQFCLRMDYDDSGEYRDIECYEDSNVNAVLCQSNAGGCEQNSELSAIGNKLFMVQHGWQFDFTHDGSILSDNYKNVGKKCGPQAKWYGWSAHSHVGTLSATLKGNGEVTIDFGNCWDQGIVKVYLDANVVGIASVGEKSKKVSVSFTPGSVLSFKDESGNAVIMLNSITFKCYESSCFLPNKDALIPDINVDKSITTAAECQNLCKSFSLCHYFSFNERNEGQNGCHLKGGMALGNLVTRQSVTFGPKECPSKAVECSRGDVMIGNDNVPMMYLNDTWSPICGHYFWNDNNATNLFCQKLGYVNGTVTPKETDQHLESYSVDSARIGRCIHRNKDIMRCTGGCNDYRTGGVCYDNEDANCSAGQKVKIRINCYGAQGSSMPGHATCTAISCPEGYSEFQGRCYYFENSRMKTWYEASRDCYLRKTNNLHFDLVSVHDSNEQRFITSLLRKQTWYQDSEITNADPRFPWIGLHKDQNHLWNDTEHVKWVDDSSLGYRNWAHDEPKNEQRDHCVHLYRDGAWNDHKCSEQRYYICASLHNRRFFVKPGYYSTLPPITTTPVSDRPGVLIASSVYKNNYYKYGPNFAADGSRSRSYSFQSRRQKDPWIQWHLYTPKVITGIKIYTRRDSDDNTNPRVELRNVTIRAGNFSINSTFKGEITKNTLCGVFEGPGEIDEHYIINCTKGIMARYVTVQMLGNYTALQINEIEVIKEPHAMKAEYGYCLNEDGVDQNTGSFTFKGLPNSFSAIDCLERCLNQSGVTGCEYHETTHGCAYHTKPISGGSGSSSYWCWTLNNGSFYDNCISRDGKVYKKDHGEFGCYHFHSNNLGRGGKVYNYDTSQEFCRNLNGTLPVIRSKEEDTSMLKLLNGYAVFLGATVNSQSKNIEWNDGPSLKKGDSYNNFDGTFNATTKLRTSDCLIVHGNTEHGGESSLNKKWGHYNCNSKFSAVICQLNIDVHSNGGLQTTTIATTSTMASSTSSTTASTPYTSLSASSLITRQNSSTRRRMLRMAYHKDFTSTEDSTNADVFETLPTLEVLNVSHILHLLNQHHSINDELAGETTEKIVSDETQDECPDTRLSQVSNREVMEKNGWKFNTSHSDMVWQKDNCGEGSWFGLHAGFAEGSVSTTFKGSGTATLSFGNCWTSSAYKVSVLLNEEVKSEAKGKIMEKEVTFSFNEGDHLVIKEDGAIIKINSLNITCN